jgi:hypothetical protein
VSVEGHDTVAPRNALRNALRNTIGDSRVTTSTTPDRAQTQAGPKPDSLRSTRAGAIWTALPARDQQLILCLLADYIVRTFGDLMSTVDSGAVASRSTAPGPLDQVVARPGRLARSGVCARPRFGL